MANKGFQIEIQKNLTEKEKEQAIDYIEKRFLPSLRDGFLWNHSTKGGHEHGKPFMRGVVGWNIMKSDLIFRRVSSRKRIFAIVRADSLQRKDGKDINLKHCFCNQCEGAYKATWKISKPETYIYMTKGELKG